MQSLILPSIFGNLRNENLRLRFCTKTSTSSLFENLAVFLKETCTAYYTNKVLRKTIVEDLAMRKKFATYKLID